MDYWLKGGPTRLNGNHDVGTWAKKGARGKDFFSLGLQRGKGDTGHSSEGKPWKRSVEGATNDLFENNGRG